MIVDGHISMFMFLNMCVIGIWEIPWGCLLTITVCVVPSMFMNTVQDMYHFVPCAHSSWLVPAHNYLNGCWLHGHINLIQIG